MNIRWALLFYASFGIFFLGPVIYILGLEESIINTIYNWVMFSFFVLFALYPFFQGYEFIKAGKKVWGYTFIALGLCTFGTFGLLSVFLLEGLGAKKRIFADT